MVTLMELKEKRERMRDGANHGRAHMAGPRAENQLHFHRANTIRNPRTAKWEEFLSVFLCTEHFPRDGDKVRENR